MLHTHTHTHNFFTKLFFFQVCPDLAHAAVSFHHGDPFSFGIASCTSDWISGPFKSWLLVHTGPLVPGTIRSVLDDKDLPNSGPRILNRVGRGAYH